jgi:hypothetical protein
MMEIIKIEKLNSINIILGYMKWKHTNF